MLKGIQKRVIVVKTPEPEIFEQAIFILSDSYLRQAEGSREQALKAAERAARSYLRECLPGKKRAASSFAKASGRFLTAFTRLTGRAAAEGPKDGSEWE